MIHYTTIEQSKHLIELGLSAETADKYYKYVMPKSDKLHHVPTLGEPVESLKWYNRGYTIGGLNKPLSLEEFCVPCWSLGALLDVMPKLPRVEFNLVLPGVDGEPPYVAFDDCRENHQVHLNFEGSTPLEAAYNTVCWLLENGYIKK